MFNLIIVDPQYDFVGLGNLAIEGGYKALLNVSDFINNLHKDINRIIITVDWHPLDHCSFKQNGGEWNIHCVQYSKGASIFQEIINICNYCNLIPEVVEKGTNRNKEAYTAFANLGIADILGEKFWELETENSEYTKLIPENEDLVICGLAGDYCVLETIKALKDLNPQIYLDGIASIDGGTKLNEYIKNNNLRIYDLNS